MLELHMTIPDNDKVWDFVRNNSNPLMMSGHIGTHIDIYNHSEIPKEYQKRDTVLIDCSNYDKNQEIGIEILEKYHIKKGDFVIFFTNIQEESIYGDEIYTKEHHQLSWELIDRLLEIRVSFIGIDCAGIRRGKEHVMADKKCEDNQTFVIENLVSKTLKGIENLEKTLIVWHRTPLLTGIPVKIFKL